MSAPASRQATQGLFLDVSRIALLSPLLDAGKDGVELTEQRLVVVRVPVVLLLKDIWKFVEPLNLGPSALKAVRVVRILGWKIRHEDYVRTSAEQSGREGAVHAVVNELDDLAVSFGRLFNDWRKERNRWSPRVHLIRPEQKRSSKCEDVHAE